MYKLINTNYFFFFLLYVSCAKASTIMLLQTSLSWHAWMSSFPFVLLVHSLMLLKYVILCLPLALLPSIFPVSDRFSMPFLRITWPKNVIFLFLMVSSNFRFTLATVSTLSFDILSVHETFNILLKNHISVASKRFCMTDEVLHVSHQLLTYRKRKIYNIDLLIYIYYSYICMYSRLLCLS